ncbi:hypothetical protein D9M68_698120 [compost metagenome]
MLDALGHAHCRPGALAMVVGGDGGVQRRQRGIGIQQRRAAQHHLLITLLARQEHRAAHRRHRPLPTQQLTVDQVLALLDGRAGAVTLGNLAGSGEQGLEVVVGHCTFLRIGTTGSRFLWGFIAR